MLTVEKLLSRTFLVFLLQGIKKKNKYRTQNDNTENFKTLKLQKCKNNYNDWNIALQLA